MNDSNHRALLVLHPGFEELEAVAPADLLIRAGVEVTLASIAPGDRVRGKNGLELTVHCGIDDADSSDFDLVVVPGGPGVAGLRSDGRCAALARRQVQAGGRVACICAAPLVLLDAGLLEGVRFTAHPSTRDELPGASGDAVVIDGPLITSAGAGTATDFGLALVRLLCGEPAARAVAEGIVWPGRP